MSLSCQIQTFLPYLHSLCLHHDLKLCELTVNECTNSTGDTKPPLGPTSLWRILLLLSSVQKSENMVVCTKSRPLRKSHEASQSRRKRTAFLRRTLALSHRSPQPPRPEPAARHTARNIGHALYPLQLPVCFSAPHACICGGLGRLLEGSESCWCSSCRRLECVCVLCSSSPLGGSPCCLGDLLKCSSLVSSPLV